MTTVMVASELCFIGHVSLMSKLGKRGESALKAYRVCHQTGHMRFGDLKITWTEQIANDRSNKACLLGSCSS